MRTINVGIAPNGAVKSWSNHRNLADRLEEAKAVVTGAFAEFDFILVQFSGGKDSVVMADLIEPWRDRVVLVWVNTGDGPPGMPEFVRGYRDRWHYVEIASDPRATWAERGPPADIASVDSATLAMPGIKVQPWAQCCSRNRIYPLRKFIIEAAVGLYKTGKTAGTMHAQREDDHAFTLGEEEQFQGIPKPFAPLWSWNETDVMAYIEERGLGLPAHYAEYRGSMDCKSCPADMTPSRRAYLERHFPDIGSEADQHLAFALDLAERELARLRASPLGLAHTGRAA